MSNAKLKFADEIARFVQMFGGLAAYGEEVGNIGSLEQARAQAEQLSAKARDELKALQEEIIQTRRAHQDSCDREKAATEVYVTEVHSKADAVLAAAEQSAAEKIANANVEASTIVEAAREQKGGLAEEISQAEHRLAAVKAEIAASEKKLQELDREHALQKGEYDRVVSEHQDFLKRIGAK